MEQKLIITNGAGFGLDQLWKKLDKARFGTDTWVDKAVYGNNLNLKLIVFSL